MFLNIRWEINSNKKFPIYYSPNLQKMGVHDVNFYISQKMD